MVIGILRNYYYYYYYCRDGLSRTNGNSSQPTLIVLVIIIFVRISIARAPCQRRSNSAGVRIQIEFGFGSLPVCGRLGTGCYKVHLCAPYRDGASLIALSLHASRESTLCER